MLPTQLPAEHHDFQARDRARCARSRPRPRSATRPGPVGEASPALAPGLIGRQGAVAWRFCCVRLCRRRSGFQGAMASGLATIVVAVERAKRFRRRHAWRRPAVAGSPGAGGFSEFAGLRAAISGFGGRFPDFPNRRAGVSPLPRQVSRVPVAKCLHGATATRETRQKSPEPVHAGPETRKTRQGQPACRGRRCPVCPCALKPAPPKRSRDTNSFDTTFPS